MDNAIPTGSEPLIASTSDLLPAVCIECGYDLRGGTSEHCPECGWTIDRQLAARGVEDQRSGTPAHRAHGWRVIDQAAVTALQAMFRPRRFARDVRIDERIAPALGVALASFVLMLTVAGLWQDWPGFVKHMHSEVICYIVAIATVIVVQSLVFATLNRPQYYPRVPWGSRFRTWLVVSLYTSGFVALWPAGGGPPIALWLDTNFYFPFSGGVRGFGPDAELGVSLVYYWWWIVLAVFLLTRNRPRWLALVSTPLVFVHTFIGSYAFMLVLSLLD